MKVNEIFQSISGEVGLIPQGTVAWFIRFQGCNLRCSWCFGIVPGRRIPKLILSRGSKVDLDKCQVGDTVLTYDEQFNIVETTVVETHAREVDTWLRITIDGTQYFVTHEHPFMTPKGIIAARNLSVGDDIYEVKANQIIAYKKLGDRNPMKNPATSRKRAKNTDYEALGRKVSATRKKRFADGTLIPTPMSAEARKQLSKMRTGAGNPNWGGGRNLNCNRLKAEIVKGVSKYKCGCGSRRFLEVHHIDGNPNNDQKNNLVVLCKSCHTKVHKKGYNFWNGNRRDGKQLQTAIGNNGKRVEAIKEFIRADIYPSVRPEPLKVYNLTCSPHNTFFLDNMWVHNCDTEQAQEKDAYAFTLNPEEIAAAIPKNSNVILTGGEPLLQNHEDLHWLVSLLDDKGCIIQVETNGSQKPFLPVCHIFDYKTPSSGEQGKMMPVDCFLGCPVHANTWIKFVIKNPEDREFVLSVMQDFTQLRPGWRGLQMALSVESGKEVQEIMSRLKETLPDLMHKIVFNFQMHKHFNLK